MAQTVIRGTQILNNTVQRQDLDISTVGQAVVTKLIQGSGISLSSTGADAGTGDVTVSSPDVVSTDAGNIATLGSDNHILVPQSQIWSVRLRSYNAIGNPTFEVDQKQCGNSFAVTTAGGTGPVIDNWIGGLTGTLRFSMQQTSGNIVIPGTNFFISSKFLRVTVTTAQTSLGVSDFLEVWQIIEGPRLRELFGDVHSVSILARSSVANLKFGLVLQDNNVTHSLSHLCSLGAANTWAVISCPNLPVWTGNFSVVPGTIGYYLGITLAAGTSQTAASNDTWLTAATIGAVGQSNFAATLSATFDLAFIQHEPGNLCSQLIDVPFQQALASCQRYYTKNYDYAVKPGTASQTGNVGTFFNAGTSWNGADIFKQTMAKVPTVTVYNFSSGAVNSVRASTDFTVSSASASQDCFGTLVTSTSGTANQACWPMYTADTGW